MAKILALLVFLLMTNSANLWAAEEKAAFAGGCFWCMVPPFDGQPGVKSVISGYAGGTKYNPKYEEVGRGITGHAESIEITFDNSKITYDQLLDIFWKQIDPTDAVGQFVDRGKQYRPAIFYRTQAQKITALKSMKKLELSKRFNKMIVVEITPLKKFWPAEEYHQYFYKKDPKRYHEYRDHAGRDEFIKAHWGESAL